MALQTLAQERANHAWSTVEKHFSEELADEAKKMPMRVRASGLGQTLAFMRAKRKAPALRASLADWCATRHLISEANDEALIRAICAKDAAYLRRATSETLAWLQWVVRFADARRKDDGE